MGVGVGGVCAGGGGGGIGAIHGLNLVPIRYRI